MRLPRCRNGRQLSVISVRARQFTSIIWVCDFLSFAAISCHCSGFAETGCIYQNTDNRLLLLQCIFQCVKEFLFVRSPAKIRTWGQNTRDASCSIRFRLLASNPDFIQMPDRMRSAAVQIPCPSRRKRRLQLQSVSFAFLLSVNMPYGFLFPCFAFFPGTGFALPASDTSVFCSAFSLRTYQTFGVHIR